MAIRHHHPANQRRYDDRDAGERMADRVTASFGSWAFILGQTVMVMAWIALNLTAWASGWDPYPFILLNLLFSTQAAYAAPLLLLSQNRQAERDRIKAEHDYRVNRLSLQYLFAWHGDAHGADCGCITEVGPAVEALLAGTTEAGAGDPSVDITAGTATVEKTRSKVAAGTV